MLTRGLFRFKNFHTYTYQRNRKGFLIQVFLLKCSKKREKENHLFPFDMKKKGKIQPACLPPSLPPPLSLPSSPLPTPSLSPFPSPSPSFLSFPMVDARRNRPWVDLNLDPRPAMVAVLRNQPWKIDLWFKLSVNLRNVLMGLQSSWEMLSRCKDSQEMSG